MSLGKRATAVRHVAGRLAPAAVALVLIGCHTWATRPVSKIKPGQTVRVVTDHGRRRAVLEEAAVAGDSVVGRLATVDTLRRSEWVPLGPGEGERTAIAVSAITRVERREMKGYIWKAPMPVRVGVFALLAALLGLLIAGFVSWQ